MIRVLALTQFAFLTLGIVAMRILVRANASEPTSSWLQFLDQWVLWLFLVPLAWVGFATLCVAYGKTVLPRIAQALGVVLAILCFLFLATVTFLT
jgi:hypothetical protein